MPLLVIIIFITAITSCTNTDPGVFIDEKESTLKQLQKLDTGLIYSVMDWPKGAVPPKWKEEYGDRGVIIVHTKKHNAFLEHKRHQLLRNKIIEAQSGNFHKMLFYYNGVKVPFEKLDLLKSLPPEKLRSVDSMNLKQAKFYYKEEAREQNIIINTKDFDSSLIKDE